MYRRLPNSEKIVYIQQYLSGEKASNICKDANVSRTIFYRWLKTYRSSHSLKNKDILASKIVKGKNHWKSLNRKQQEEIIKLAIKFPTYSAQKIASVTKVSTHGVWNVLKRYSLNTRKDRGLYISKYGRSFIKCPAYNDKLNMITRYEQEEKAHIICKDFAVSRTIFYKWLKRYRQSNNDIAALNDIRPKGEKHWRFVPGATGMVLDLVVASPEFSVNKLTKEIQSKLQGAKSPQPPLEKGAKVMSVLGRHGIYNILKRLDLNTYEKRLAYARAQVPIVVPKPQIAEVSLPPQPRYSFLSFLSPPLRNYFSSSFGVTASICLIVILIPIVLLSSFLPADSFGQRIAYFIAFISLLCGLFFFLYSLKYYLSIAYVLSFSRREDGQKDGSPSTGSGFARFLAGIFGVSISVENVASDAVSSKVGTSNVPFYNNTAVGLQADLSNVKLERNPFVSVHVSTYNEKRVIDRLLSACTSFDYPNYEVIVADDSNDETVGLIEKWAHNPHIKISHRDSREGYKGGALQQALRVTDSRAEFILVFDADFIPYPDTIVQFLKYFQLATGGLDKISPNPSLIKRGNQLSPPFLKGDGGISPIAAVQGYQWHVLNKSENWITRGVRSEYAGSYVIERSGAELYHGLKQISGSVYMIRRDVLQGIGWGTSLTEDFELTLKLYEAGFKVVYTPYIQAPAEAVSTIKRLIRQRMRWAEGHSFNIKRMLIPLLFGRHEMPVGIATSSRMSGTPRNDRKGRVFIPSPLTRSEKMELVYLAPYYLQAALFIVGTLCWFIAEVIFQVRLPFWTEVWGWSLVATNLFALPLMNMIGMFMEESDEKDYLGIISFVVLSYIVAPFQAYAAVKGFLEDVEGPWFRTPKTGRITDTLMPGRIARFVRGIFGRHAPAEFKKSNKPKELGNLNTYFALATANNQFGDFKIRRKNIRWAGNLSVVALLIISTLLANFANTMSFSESAYASQPIMKTVGDNNVSTDNEEKVDLGISSEETLKKEPKNKDTIIKNALAKEISGYRSIAKKTHSGELVEFIFHESAKVRVKLGHREIEFQTNYIGGQRINPKSAKVYQDQEVIYEEIVKGIDLKYTINGDLMTEEFIVKDREAAKTFIEPHFAKASRGTVVQTVQTVDVKVVSPENEKTFGFFTDEGKELFKFASPFAKDNDGKVNNNISISLEKSNIGHKLTKTLGGSARSWLVDPKRAYPVAIDPTVIVSGSIGADSEVQFGGLQRKLAAVNTGSADAWCNDTSGITCTSFWTKRRKITFNNSASAENLTNFPIMVKLNSSRITYADTQSAGQDLRFVDPTDNTVVLPHEVEEFNETGDDFVWVKVPQIDSGSTTDYIWMYYGNGSIGDGSDPANVWETNYKGVWHLKENPAGGAPQMLDSTTNNGDGTSAGTMTSGDQVGGQIDGSLDLDGTNDTISVPDSSIFSFTNGSGTDLPYTLSAWVFMRDITETAGIVSKWADAADDAEWVLYITGSTMLIENYHFDVTNIFRGRTVALNAGAHQDRWMHVVATYDGSEAVGGFAIYFDGVRVDTTNSTLGSYTGMSSVDSPVRMGSYDDDSATFLNGIIDHVSVAATNRSADWVEAEFKSGADTINSFGGEQTSAGDINTFYAFYNDAGVVSYKKSTNAGASWGSAVTVSSNGSDTDNHNPSIAISNNFIHVFWVDDGDNEVHARRLDTNSDTLGTECLTLTSSANISSNYMVSVAQLSDTSAMVAFSDTSGGTAGVDVYEVTSLDGACAMTDVHPGNITFGSQGAGLTDGDRPVLVGLSSTTAAVIFQDGDLSFSYYDVALDEWTRNNQQIANVADSVYSVTTDGTTIWILSKSGTTAANLYSLNTSTSDITETQIDSAASATNGQDNVSDIDMYCISDTDCKIVYTDLISDAAPDLIFVDCNNAVCSSSTAVTLTSDCGVASAGCNPAIHCSSGTDCHIVFQFTDAIPMARFVDCDGADNTNACSTNATVNTNADIGGATTRSHLAIDCPTGTNCKFIYGNDTGNGVDFVDCANDQCAIASDVITEVIDFGVSVVAPKVALDCPSPTACKVVAQDIDAGTLVLVDCSGAVTTETCAVPPAPDIIDASNVSATADRVPVAIDCAGAPTDCKVAYGDDTDDDLTFADCNDTDCDSPTRTDIDLTGGATTNTSPRVDMHCLTATDCKILYEGTLTSGSEVAYFVDCDSAACTSGSALADLGNANPRFGGAIYCPATDNCKMAYYEGTTGTAPTVQFADCSKAKCMPDWTDAADPFTGATNVLSVSITYDSANADLYAHIIKDTTEQAYWKTTDAASISWGAETSYAFDTTVGSLSEMSAPIKATSTDLIGVVLRRSTVDNFEFAPLPDFSLILIVILPVLPRLLRKIHRRRC